MLEAVLRSFFRSLARSPTAARLASRYGMRGPRGFARRFVAGETLEESLPGARALAATGLLLTLNRLGERVATLADADAATGACVDMIPRIAAAEIERNVSLKLSQLGLLLDRAIATDNLRKILDPAGRHGFFVRIDMEDSSTVQETLDVHATLWEHGYRHVGLVLQSALLRSEADLERLNAMGVRIRLVKGTYKEPKPVAHQRKSAVDAAFLRMTEALLRDGTYPAFGTHDAGLIEAVKASAARLGIAKDGFEFQMLYGVRRDLQAALAAEGYRTRIYVPFGQHWFPYFMRRLGEHPANVGVVLRGFHAER